MPTKNRMRVGIVSPPFLPVVKDMNQYGGTERVVAELGRGLAMRGHKVTVFAPEGSDISENLSIVNTGKPLWGNGYKLTEDDIRKGLKSTLDIAYKHAGTLDVLHFNFDEGMLDMRFDNIPNLTTIHGDTASKAIREMYGRSNFRPIAFISKSQRNRMPEANYAGVVYNGIDPDKFIPSYMPGEYLVFLGRVSPDKGMHIALDVAHETNTRLVAMYREPIRNSSDPLARADWEYYEDQIKPRFARYNGIIEHQVDAPRAVIDSYLRGALALIGPSGFPPSKWAEPFGLFVVESMASGTPAVVYNKGGPAEIVVHGETGYIAKSADEKTAKSEIINAVERVRDGREELRLMSRLRVEEEFSTDKMAEGYENLYSNLLKGTLRKERDAAVLQQ